jgi:hypothetical protein
VTLWFVAVTPAAAQTSRIEGGSATLGDFVFQYETRLEPPVPPIGDGLNMLVLTTPPDTVHRVMLDRSQKVYFGYDARVTQSLRSPDGTTLYHLAFAQLTLTSELQKLLGDDAKTWKSLPSPRFPESRTIFAGAVLELTLLTNATWGQRMTDYVTLQPAPAPGFNVRLREFAFGTGRPRDFTVADVVLTLSDPSVTVTRSRIWQLASPPRADNGNRVGAPLNRPTRGEASGSVVWIYVPGDGRFLLSLIPRGEFVRAGSVRGTSLTFTLGETYNVTSATRIVPGDGAFNLYVLHQPGWKPDFPNANLDTVHIGAADRAEYLLGR